MILTLCCTSDPTADLRLELSNDTSMPPARKGIPTLLISRHRRKNPASQIDHLFLTIRDGKA